MATWSVQGGLSTIFHSNKELCMESAWRSGRNARIYVRGSATSLTTSIITNALECPQLGSASNSSPSPFPVEEKLDRKGLLRTPRAARELALCVLYAARIRDVEPKQILQQRMKMKTGATYKHLLRDYNPSAANNDPLYVDDAAKAREIEKKLEEETVLEADVLTAPLPCVYNKFVRVMADRLIQSTMHQWSQQEAVIEQLLPRKWKHQPEAVLLEVCILHMAITEISAHGLSPKIVINEAVELAKRFCDGAAFRLINGCLGNFARNSDLQQLVSAAKLQP